MPFVLSNLIVCPISSRTSGGIPSNLVFDFYQQSRKFRKWNFLTFHISASLLFGIFHKILSDIIGLLLERLFLEAETKSWRELLELWQHTYFDILGSIFIYWLVILILIGLDYYRKFNDQNTRRLELEGELGKAQLKSMKMQMNPHFLFNAFNTIAMMVRQKENDEAVDMIGGLSDMFRLSLNKDLRQFVPLSEEVDLLKKYLAIESLRYRDRLRIKWNIDDSVLNDQVPDFVLQPIVENAFKHGISKTLNNALLSISVYHKDGKLILIQEPDFQPIGNCKEIKVSDYRIP